MIYPTVHLTIVMFGYEEVVYALYIDNNLVFYGDNYHHKITSQIKGFIKGLKYSEWNIIEQRVNCIDVKMNEDVTEGMLPPKSLVNILFA